jgi:hypothetical protein
MKCLTQITIQIKGRGWTFKLFSDRNFDKLHNPNGDENNAGMTVFSQYEVHFPKSEWGLVELRHEIGHILKFMSNTHSAELDAFQVEENMCDIIGAHGPEICFWAEQVAEKFLNHNKHQ